MKQSSVALLSLGRLSAFGGDDGGGSPSAGPAAEVPENLAENAVETVTEDAYDLPDLGANAEAKFGKAALASGATVTGIDGSFDGDLARVSIGRPCRVFSSMAKRDAARPVRRPATPSSSTSFPPSGFSLSA